MPRFRKKTYVKKTDDEKLKSATERLTEGVNLSLLKDDTYIYGFDPGKRNFGWAIFKITNGVGEYFQSGYLQLPEKAIEDRVNYPFLYNFLNNKMNNYPASAFCWERAIGRGMANVREDLGEVQGIIKLCGFLSNDKLVMKPAATTNVEVFVLGAGGEKRKDKKIAMCTKIKDLFKEELDDRKISSSGHFTHEADAIACVYSFLCANGFIVRANEGDSDVKED